MVTVRARLELKPGSAAVLYTGLGAAWWMHISSPPHSASAARMQGPMAFADAGMAWIFTGMMGN